MCVKMKPWDPTSSVVVGSESELFDVIIKKIIANLFMIRVDDNYLRYVSFGKLKMLELSCSCPIVTLKIGKLLT